MTPIEENNLRDLVVETGHKLLKQSLVARTWGNVSARLSVNEMLVTPSGLDYMATTPKDIVKVNLETGEWDGARKPSGERKIHIAAYQTFPEDGFVIHTHQDFASAISLTGLESFEITEEERKALGGVAAAKYGLPGTKKLTKSVKACFENGAHTVFMEKHGVVISAKDEAEAMERATLLEEICKRNVKGSVLECSKNCTECVTPTCVAKSDNPHNFLLELRANFPEIDVVKTPYILTAASKNEPILAQLDDMAQMIGGKVKIAESSEEAIRILEKRNAVLIPGIGAVVKSDDPGDREALKLLVNKAAICKLHTDALKVKSKISGCEVLLMHLVYLKKYSKQKGGKK